MSDNPLACARKQRYFTERDANSVARLRRNDKLNPSEPLYSYYCGICKGWHLSKTDLGVTA